MPGASGRGISAPQIGAPVRVILVETDRKRTTMLNPEIVDVGPDDFSVWDDCFCFPDLLVRVNRAHHVAVKYLDARGREQVVSFDGPMAELMQHEIDHLNGVLFVDRLGMLQKQLHKKELKQLESGKRPKGGPSHEGPAL